MRSDRVTGIGIDQFSKVLPIGSIGSLRNLFCIHEASGLSWWYERLIPYIDPDFSVYGLQACGFHEGDALPQSIEDMASDYLAEIRKIQKHRPYYLLGWSFGGLVAHQIAVSLHRDGERVALLALLDTNLRQDNEVRLQLMRNIPSRRMDDGIAQAMADVKVRIISTQIGYRPSVFDGDLSLVVAAKESRRLSPDVWRPFTTGEITVHEVDCKHTEMLSHNDAIATIGRVIMANIRNNANLA
jgi:nonribosomal peptide synthetase DhbF